MDGYEVFVEQQGESLQLKVPFCFPRSILSFSSEMQEIKFSEPKSPHFEVTCLPTTCKRNQFFYLKRKDMPFAFKKMPSSYTDLIKEISQLPSKLYPQSERDYLFSFVEKNKKTSYEKTLMSYLSDLGTRLEKLSASYQKPELITLCKELTSFLKSHESDLVGILDEFTTGLEIESSNLQKSFWADSGKKFFDCQYAKQQFITLYFSRQSSFCPETFLDALADHFVQEKYGTILHFLNGDQKETFNIERISQEGGSCNQKSLLFVKKATDLGFVSRKTRGYAFDSNNELYGHDWVQTRCGDKVVDSDPTMGWVSIKENPVYYVDLETTLQNKELVDIKAKFVAF